MGKTIYIAFLVIFAVATAKGQEQTARVANSDSTANVSTTYKPTPTEQSSVNAPAGDLTFAVKIVPGTSKKFNVEVVSPKSGYAEVSLLNSRGDQMLILHKGKIKSGPITFGIDPVKIKPGLYYVVSKYEGGLQVADKFTVTK